MDMPTKRRIESLVRVVNILTIKIQNLEKEVELIKKSKEGSS